MNIDRIIGVLSRDKTWTVVSGVAAMASAACAAYAIRQAGTIWKQQYEGNRPYFALEKPAIEKAAEGEGDYQVKIPLKNVGVRPAGNLEIRLMVVKSVDTKEPESTHDYSCVNDIPSGQNPTPGGIKISFGSLNVAKRYFVLQARYFDAVTRRRYVQPFYMTWAGLEQGKGPSGFAHAKHDEAEKLAKSLAPLMWHP